VLDLVPLRDGKPDFLSPPNVPKLYRDWSTDNSQLMMLRTDEPICVVCEAVVLSGSLVVVSSQRPFAGIRIHVKYRS